MQGRCTPFSPWSLPSSRKAASVQGCLFCGPTWPILLTAPTLHSHTRCFHCLYHVCLHSLFFSHTHPLSLQLSPPPYHRDEEVNYFPSRFDPSRNAAPTPMNKAALSGRRERAVIAKENNFQQVGGGQQTLLVWADEGQQTETGAEGERTSGVGMRDSTQGVWAYEGRQTHSLSSTHMPAWPSQQAALLRGNTGTVVGAVSAPADVLWYVSCRLPPWSPPSPSVCLCHNTAW